MALQLLRAIKCAIGRHLPLNLCQKAWISWRHKANFHRSYLSCPSMPRQKLPSSNWHSDTIKQETAQSDQILISKEELVREAQFKTKIMKSNFSRITSKTKIMRLLGKDRKTTANSSLATIISLAGLLNRRQITERSQTTLEIKVGPCSNSSSSSSSPARAKSSKSCARRKCVAIGRTAIVSTVTR